MNEAPEGNCYYCGKRLGNFAHKWMFDPRAVNHDKKIMDAEFCSQECALSGAQEKINTEGWKINPEWEKLQNEPETIRVMSRKDFIAIESRNQKS